VTTQSPKSQKENGAKKVKLSDLFKKITLKLHGVRLPKFEIEERHLEKYAPQIEAAAKGGKVDNKVFLRAVCAKRFYDLGLHNRQDKKMYIDRMVYELGILEELGFVDYILLVWSVVNYCNEEDIPLGLGRGSAAGSMALYLLGVTDIDPLKYELFFERFVSKARAKKSVVDGVTYLDGSLMCDVDIDVCYYKRKDVLTHLREKFGGKTSKILTLNTLSGKLVMKECGKVLGGKSETEMNGVSGLIPKVFGQVEDIASACETVPEFGKWCKSNPRVFKVANKIKNLNKNKGVHPSAILLSYDRMDESCPCELDSSKEPVSSFDMDWSSISNVKLDVLGLRTVSVVNECCKIINGVRPKEQHITLKTMAGDLEEEAIYEKLNEQIQLGLRIGIFQIEADVAYKACQAVKPRNLEHLSGVLALARPGAMDYIKHYADFVNTGVPEPTHPVFETVLNKTGGIVLYQEQMMKMAHMIGFTLDEAEILRRIVGKKKVSEVKKWKKKIRDKVKQNNFKDLVGTEDVGDFLWKVLEASANYSYNKSHSISYAALAAITAKLKSQHPKEFFLSLLRMTAFEPDPLTEVGKINQELRFFDIKLLAPNLLKSDMEYSIEGDNIRFGLTAIKGISEKSKNKLKSFKNKYSNKFEVFQGASEAGLGIGILSGLIQAGALEGCYDGSRSRTVAEAQLFNLLTDREKGYVFDLAEEFSFDLMKLVKYLHEKHIDIKGKPIIKESRIQTIRRNFEPYKQIYYKNKTNEAFANWYYENTLLGYTHGKALREVTPEYSHLDSVEHCLNQEEGDPVSFIATVIDTFKSKSKKGTPYFKMTVKDETGESTVFLFAQKKKDHIEACKTMNNGELPSKKSIVIVKGTKKDGDTIFASLIKAQDQQIYMKLSEIKGK
jgi:DNA polymerase-3 subunit alpha